MLYFTIASMLQLDCAEMEKIVKSWLLLDLKLMIEMTFVMQDFFIGNLVTSLAAGWYYVFAMAHNEIDFKVCDKKITIETGSKGSDCLFCQTFKNQYKVGWMFLDEIGCFW